jgi:predicted phosphodiesterase
MRLDCLSDTHNLHVRLAVPDGDVLLHAGDFTSRGTEREVAAFGAFLARLPHRHKVVVAGNHDFLFERSPERARELLGDVLYLEDALAEVGGITVYGSPWQPWFHDWAFNLPRGPALAAKWAAVPERLDVLVTHTPPHGLLDRTAHGENVGCEELTRALARIRPRLHVFGHIHEAHGATHVDGTLAVNACSCDLRYRAVNAPVVVDLVDGGARLVH